jgi:hypothetical protein
MRDSVDLDGDGRPDLIYEYAPGYYSHRREFNASGTAAHTETAQLLPGDAGMYRVMKEDDSNGDGVPDVRLSYTVDPRKENITTEIEEDSDFDGTYDTQYQGLTTRQQEGLATAVSTPGTPCSSAQLNEAEEAFDRAIKTAIGCLKDTDWPLTYHFMMHVTSRNWTIQCVNLPEGICGRWDPAWLHFFGAGPTLLIAPATFTPTCGLESKLFHEVLQSGSGRFMR